MKSSTSDERSPSTSLKSIKAKQKRDVAELIRDVAELKRGVAELKRDVAEPIPSTSQAGKDSIGEDHEPYAKRHLYTSEVLSMYNLAKLIRELGTREQCIRFAEQQGLIKTEKICQTHKTKMNVNYSGNKTVGTFNCTKRSCREKNRISRCVGTWFENMRIELPHVFYLMYCFAHNWSHDKVILEDFMREERGGRCLSPSTISNWYNYCRETIVLHQLEKQEHLGKIGGEGKVVQINETKFGSRTHSKGKHVEGHWILGVIEDGSDDLRLEVCDENVRSAEVLISFIEKHVQKKTIIHTQIDSGPLSVSSSFINCLSEHGYIHTNEKFNDSDPGTGSQSIESQWQTVKKFFYYKSSNNHPQNIADIIVEYLWRRDVSRHKKDPFTQLLKAVKYVYGPK